MKFQLHKLVVAGNPPSIRIEFTICNLKAFCKDPTRIKQIPIVFKHKEPAMLNIMLYLFWLTIQDNVFGTKLMIEQLMCSKMLMSSLPKMTKLHMKESMLKQPIFQPFVSKVAGTLAWEVDPVKGWHAYNLDNCIMASRGPAGIPKFQLYELHQLCAHALNNLPITKADRLCALTHSHTEQIFVDNYLLNRVEINVLAHVKGPSTTIRADLQQQHHKGTVDQAHLWQEAVS